MKNRCGLSCCSRVNRTFPNCAAITQLGWFAGRESYGNSCPAKTASIVGYAKGLGLEVWAALRVPQLQWLGFEPHSCFSRNGNLPWKTCTAGVGFAYESDILHSYLVSLLAEHVIQLPLFGYNVFSVERISAPDIPSPCIVGVNQEEIVAMSREIQVGL